MAKTLERPRRRLGELLVDKGLIEPAQLKQALAAQAKSGSRLGTQLLMEGWVTEAQLAAFLSEQLGLPAIHCLSEIDPGVVPLFPAHVAIQHCIIPVSLRAGTLRVAIADPSDTAALAAARSAVPYEIQPMVAPELVVSYGVRRFYAPDSPVKFDPAPTGPQFSREVILGASVLFE